MKKIITLTLNPAIDRTVTVEDFSLGGTNRSLSETKEVGGKGINVARVARNFYDSVTAVGFATEEFLPLLSEVLDREGIESRFVTISGETRTNFKIFDQKENLTTELNGQGFSVTQADEKKIEEILETLFPETAVLVLTGSLPKGMAPDFYSRLVHRCRGRDIPVILDADGEAFRLGAAAAPKAIKPNLAELMRYTGRVLDSEEKLIQAMRELVDGGVSLVVTSVGSRGAYFMEGETAFYVPSLPVEVKGTVGAGDSMVALMAYGLATGLLLSEMAAICTAAASATVSKSGTGLCNREETMKRLDEVRIEEWICE